MAVVASTISSKCQHLGRHVLGQAVLEAGAVGMDDLGDSGDLGGSSGGSGCTFANDQHMHITAAGLGGRHGVQGRGLDRSVVVFCNNERSHFSRLSLKFFMMPASPAAG
ncbi:hypothetical protein SDC9_112580 [bioreactor metagenome]|uniref:Uncharacterized protein n=1 Tax=bioreactor metagenome TaxID=1076179 RepID=A0A645BR31_9ZZZZ